MSQFSNYLETQIANYHRGTNLPAAPTLRVGFWDGNPTDTMTGGTEKSATISARQPVTFGAISTNGAFRQISNSSIVDFGTAAGACSITHFGQLDALTAGNGLLYGGLTASKTVNAADPVTIPVGNLVVKVGGTASTYLRDLILNWLKGTTAASAPTLYVALYNGDPGASGTDVTTQIRVAGRVAVTWGTATDGVVSNSAIVDFGTAANAADVTHIRVYDASTAGNIWHTAALNTSRNVNAGDPVTFAVGELVLTIS